MFDRNGDGLINNGSELFGDQTLKYGGSGKCQDGFEALAQEDTNGDGVVDKNKTNLANFLFKGGLNVCHLTSRIIDVLIFQK